MTKDLEENIVIIESNHMDKVIKDIQDKQDNVPDKI
jgi:hypothetical protein